jgi:glycosyltransferase involved in cell wall biosynthesis
MAYNFNMPVLASRVGHFPETIRHSHNGYLANGGDTDEMAKIMELSISEPIDRQNVKETAKEFSWDNYARTILNYID